LLDVCLVRQLDLWKALNLSYSMLTKQLANAGSAEYFKATDVIVQTQEPMMYHADGEYIGKATAFKVFLEPLSLKVVTPLK